MGQICKFGVFNCYEEEMTYIVFQTFDVFKPETCAIAGIVESEDILSVIEEVYGGSELKCFSSSDEEMDFKEFKKILNAGSGSFNSVDYVEVGRGAGTYFAKVNGLEIDISEMTHFILDIDINFFRSNFFSNEIKVFA